MGVSFFENELIELLPLDFVSTHTISDLVIQLEKIIMTP